MTRAFEGVVKTFCARGKRAEAGRLHRTLRMSWVVRGLRLTSLSSGVCFTRKTCPRHRTQGPFLWSNPYGKDEPIFHQ